MRQPRSSLRRSAGGRGVRLKTAAQTALLLAMLSYAVVGWRAWSRRGGGALELASRGGCFGPPEERAIHRAGGGGGPLRNIASAHLHQGRLSGGLCGGRKVVAFAITLTKEGNHLDGAAVLAASIDATCETSEFLCDLVAFLHDDIGLETENLLRHLGFLVMRPGIPVKLREIKDETTRFRVEKGGCCGPAELMKFFAYTLTDYHRVVHLDTDAVILQPLDILLDAEESLLYTTDVNMSDLKKSPVMPVQGGFLVIRPDPAVFDDLVEIVKNTPFSAQGWGGTSIGLFWGGITVQGLLPYYYEHRAPPGTTYRSVDRCEYNNMVDRPNCQAVELSKVRSAHFTNCGKPWECRYPHPKQPLCTSLVERWFQMRIRAEHSLGLVPTEACPRGFQASYTPMSMLPPTAATRADGP